MLINLLAFINSPWMQLDGGTPSDCQAKKVFYTGLLDGNHTFEVCTNGSQGVGCASYGWTVG